MSEGSLKEVSPYVLNLYEMFRGDAVSEDTFIPFFNTKVPILFIAGKDDQFYPSLEQVCPLKINSLILEPFFD